MGARGPVPNRSEDLARPRERKGGQVDSITKGVSQPATIPEPDPDWHAIAVIFWHSALESGQASFYQSSDYAFLYSLCDDLSYYKKGVKRSGQMLASIYSAMERLLITEGDRRRVRVELDEPESDEPGAEVVVLDGYRDALG